MRQKFYIWQFVWDAMAKSQLPTVLLFYLFIIYLFIYNENELQH